MTELGEQKTYVHPTVPPEDADLSLGSYDTYLDTLDAAFNTFGGHLPWFIGIKWFKIKSIYGPESVFDDLAAIDAST